MMRQSSSRNQRNKGFRVRHALQIGLLIAVCFWLLYQVKHSHDKKLVMEEKNSRILNKVAETHKQVFNLGRKDLPQVEEVGLSHDTQDDKVEKELEEEEEKDGNQQDEADEEDGGGNGDDEIDEQDHEKGEEEELDGDEEKEMQDGEFDFFEDQEEHDMVAQEAREENYKRDDVADSVHREAQATEVEGGSEDARTSNEEHAENVEKDDLVIQNVINEKSGLSTDQNTSDAGIVDNSQANMASGVPAMSNLIRNSSEANETISNHSLLNYTSTSNNTWSEISVSKGHPNEKNGNADGQKENIDERKNLEVDSSSLKEEASSNSNSVEPSNQKSQSNFNLTGVIHDSKEESRNNTIPLDMVTNELQNETLRQSTAEDHNSTVSLESQESNTLTEDTAVNSMNTRLGMQVSSNVSKPDEVTGVAHGEDNASSHHIITDEEKETRTDLSILPNTHNDSRNVDGEPIE